MRIIEPSFTIESEVDGEAMLKRIEKYTRVCYKSEGKITPDSAKEFIRKIFHTNKHQGIIEHEAVTVRIICDRGVGNEWTRHRIASFLQASTRYISYKTREIEFVRPPWVNLESPTPADSAWFESCVEAERRYCYLIEQGWKPQQARNILPLSLATEIVCTMNLRSWRNFFQLRTAPGAHPQMRQIAIPLLAEFQRLIPVIFEDIHP